MTTNLACRYWKSRLSTQRCDFVPAATAATPVHPLSQFVLKVHGRCDLSCDHCYVYEHADQSWRFKDLAMSPQTMRVAAQRIAEHARDRSLPAVRVVLHGGEPLLLGPQRLGEMVADLRRTIEPVTKLHLYMQTNSVRLTEAFAEVLLHHGIKIGVSLDGDRLANDRHRRFANGASSYDHVIEALRLLRRPSYRTIYAGILCTVDVGNDPIAVYESLLSHMPPRVDFLLPHATWDSPPPRHELPTPYADWLMQIYTRWQRDGQPMRIRMFDSLLSTAAGGPTGSEQVGIGPADLLVVETNGSWEQADSLKTAFDGAPETGMSVFSHTVDEVAAHPQIASRQLGLAGLSAECRACPLVSQCGGGLYAHRYRSGSGFDNPSVYCADLKELINAMNETSTVASTNVKEDESSLPEDLISQIGSGLGDVATLRFLASTQLAITRALMAGVADGIGTDAEAGAAWRLLSDVDQRHRAAADTVLSHPYARVWAVRRLQRKGNASHGYLSALALAAAIRADLAAEIPLTLDDGHLYLPGMGTLRLPGAVGRARISVEGGILRLHADGVDISVDLGRQTPDEFWQPVPYVLADGVELALEFSDSHRDCHRFPPEEGLSSSDVDRWQLAFSGAWDSIQADAPEQLPGLRTGLRLLAPLQVDPAGGMRSATGRHAFGAVGVAIAEPGPLAVMIVHEFQHGKLGALIDLVDLFDRNAKQVFTVGWKPDPRPVEGALQGTYAHLAVARMWHTRAARGGPQQELARLAFKQYYAWTESALLALSGSSAFTPAGEQVVAEMATALTHMAS